jgi:hypothetical protein
MCTATTASSTLISTGSTPSPLLGCLLPARQDLTALEFCANRSKFALISRANNIKVASLLHPWPPPLLSLDQVAPFIYSSLACTFPLASIFTVGSVVELRKLAWYSGPGQSCTPDQPTLGVMLTSSEHPAGLIESASVEVSTADKLDQSVSPSLPSCHHTKISHHRSPANDADGKTPISLVSSSTSRSRCRSWRMTIFLNARLAALSPRLTVCRVGRGKSPSCSDSTVLYPTGFCQCYSTTSKTRKCCSVSSLQSEGS